MPGQNSSLIESFQHAFAGMWLALRSQRNARIHVAIATVVLMLGIFVGLKPVQWAIIVLTTGFVFVAELFNTVIESVIDLVTEEYHPLAKQAKDVAAAGVLISAIVAVVVGALILGPPLLAKVGWRP